MRRRFVSYVLVVLVTLVLSEILQPLAAIQTLAQGDCQTFPQTGKTVCGQFLTYWNTHGGLAQQGYPVSDLLSEKSDIDGKIYTVQYFERAVLEAHPENASPNDVLLTLLGDLRYHAIYPNGTPDQVPNTDVDSQLFSETGKHVGGVFLRYWNTHGGLAQQGLPISDEFIEISKLDGKPYRVQYFERAVFEYHPEYAGTEYEVLLTQLGTLRYQEKYVHNGNGSTPAPNLTPSPTTPIATTPIPPTSVPSNKPDCSGIPTSADVHFSPNCVAYGVPYNVEADGFQPGETVQNYVSRPDGSHSTVFKDNATSKGQIIFGGTTAITPIPGLWTWVFTGLTSGKRDEGSLKVTGPDVSGCTDGPPPDGTDASVSPVCGRIGTTFTFAAIGFIPGETVGYYWTTPNQSVYGANFQLTADENGFVIGPTLIHNIYAMTGIWAVSLEGVESHHKAVAYLKLYP
jgi:hypothetical protein